MRGKAREALEEVVDCPACAPFWRLMSFEYGEATAAQMMQKVSRHRYKYAPPTTPPGFWDLDF